MYLQYWIKIVGIGVNLWLERGYKCKNKYIQVYDAYILLLFEST